MSRSLALLVASLLVGSPGCQGESKESKESKAPAPASPSAKAPAAVEAPAPAEAPRSSRRHLAASRLLPARPSGIAEYDDGMPPDTADEAQLKVDSLVASAGKEEKTNPVGALLSYKKALAKDKRAGGTRTREIRLLIAQIAPRAARSRMAKAEYAEAKKAADDAARYDQADAVADVYEKLERVAKSMYKKALRLRSKGKSEEALLLLRDATRIAPKDTEVYDQLREAMKAR